MNIPFAVDKLHLEKGDILVLKANGDESLIHEDGFLQHIKSIKEFIASTLGFKVSIIILSNEITLESVSREDLQKILDAK